jgi:hypothetical protein
VTWPVAVPALVAIVGLLATYWNSLRLAKRKDRLERVNRQLGELYGPLLALTSASNRSWSVFREQYRSRTQAYWDQRDPPTPEEAEAWRRWMTAVFMPMNRRMRDVVVSRADLLIEETIADCLLELCAHVAAYEAILASWAQDRFDDHKPALRFPRAELEAYAADSFRRLKEEQTRLIGQDRVSVAP